MRRAHEAAIHNDDTVDQNDTCRSIWTPPTPPPSSSPVRDNVLERDVFRQHDLPSQQARTGPLRDANHKRRIVRPLASRRPQPSSPTTMRDLSKTDTRLSLQSAADWHHRLTLQCAQRARAQRQSRIDHQRNGLSNEIVRPDYESREELAIWKRLATREKLAVESEMGEFLKDEYDLMLREIERGETGSPSSTEGEAMSKKGRSRICHLTAIRF